MGGHRVTHGRPTGYLRVTNGRPMGGSWASIVDNWGPVCYGDLVVGDNRVAHVLEYGLCIPLVYLFDYQPLSGVYSAI